MLREHARGNSFLAKWKFVQINSIESNPISFLLIFCTDSVFLFIYGKVLFMGLEFILQDLHYYLYIRIIKMTFVMYFIEIFSELVITCLAQLIKLI